MLKQSQLAEGIASLRFTPLAMTTTDCLFLEHTHLWISIIFTTINI